MQEIADFVGSSGETTVTASQISDSTAVGRNVLTAADAGAARTAIGAGTSSLALGTTGATALAGDTPVLSANAIAAIAELSPASTAADIVAALQTP
jgi:hypothetical protein